MGEPVDWLWTRCLSVQFAPLPRADGTCYRDDMSPDVYPVPESIAQIARLLVEQADDAIAAEHR